MLTTTFADRAAESVGLEAVEAVFVALVQRGTFGAFASRTSGIVSHVAMSALPESGREHGV